MKLFFRNFSHDYKSATGKALHYDFPRGRGLQSVLYEMLFRSHGLKIGIIDTDAKLHILS